MPSKFRRYALLIFFCALSCLAFLAAQRVDDAVLNGGGKQRGDWPTYGIDYAETRYSPLTLINAANAGRLIPGWSTEIGGGGGARGAAAPASPPAPELLAYTLEN